MKKFVVYSWQDPTTELPFYIGKGSVCRMGQRTHGRSDFFKKKLSKIELENNCKIKPQIVKEFTSETEAHEFEKELILKYGRRIDNTGILVNLTVGGEGMSGYQYPGQSQGTKNSSSKLSDDDVKFICVLINNGYNNEEIQFLLNYKVDSKAIGLIRNGKRWKHITTVFINPQSTYRQMNSRFTEQFQYSNRKNIIHDCYTSHLTNKDIALKYQLKQNEVHKIRQYKQWRDAWLIYGHENNIATTIENLIGDNIYIQSQQSTLK